MGTLRNSIVQLHRMVYTSCSPISAPVKLLSTLKPLCMIQFHSMLKAAQHMFCNFALFIIKSGRFLAMIPIMIMCASMSHQRVIIDGGMASIQAFRSAVEATNNVLLRGSIHKGNYCVPLV